MKHKKSFVVFEFSFQILQIYFLLQQSALKALLTFNIFHTLF